MGHLARMQTLPTACSRKSAFYTVGAINVYEIIAQACSPAIRDPAATPTDSKVFPSPNASALRFSTTVNMRSEFIVVTRAINHDEDCHALVVLYNWEHYNNKSVKQSSKLVYKNRIYPLNVTQSSSPNASHAG